ncbi:hypothetical protein E0H62_02625 [Rhizobium leguminosarum bv. viciae]|nr:hypothetical protein E0H62_02625 [Rhizobium leguminosarum bv. viciae]
MSSTAWRRSLPIMRSCLPGRDHRHDTKTRASRPAFPQGAARAATALSFCFYAIPDGKPLHTFPGIAPTAQAARCRSISSTGILV